MNLLKVHYMQIILVALAPALAGAAAKFPAVAQPWVVGAAALCAVIGATLGVLSPSAATPAPAATPADVKVSP